MVKRLLACAKGMTLIEVMVALVISVIGMAGTLALLGTLLKGSDFSRRMTEGSTLLQSRIEQAAIQTVTATSPADGCCPGATGSNCSEGAFDQFGTNDGGVYLRTCQVSTVTDTAGARRRFTVQVMWNDSISYARNPDGGTPHTIAAWKDRTP